MITVGRIDDDAVLAAGVVPIATTEWFGGHPGAIFPWAEESLAGAEPPEYLPNIDGIRFERIAALRPDLILALYTEMSESDYETLAGIAPTVAQPGDYVDLGVPWQLDLFDADVSVWLVDDGAHADQIRSNAVSAASMSPASAATSSSTTRPIHSPTPCRSRRCSAFRSCSMGSCRCWPSPSTATRQRRSPWGRSEPPLRSSTRRSDASGTGRPNRCASACASCRDRSAHVHLRRSLCRPARRCQLRLR